MDVSWLVFLAAAGATLGCGWWMLRTMSMLKAGLALMGSALGAAVLLFTLHADIVAAMTIMMFGPAMLGMILFMLMLMEDSGGFMMTAANVPPPQNGTDIEAEVLRVGAPMLGPVSEIAVQAENMDMAMTNSQTRWGGWIAIGFFVTNVAVVLLTPWKNSTDAPSVAQAELIGEALLGKYMMVFEGAALLILLTVVAATMLGRNEG